MLRSERTSSFCHHAGPFKHCPELKFQYVEPYKKLFKSQLFLPRRRLAVGQGMGVQGTEDQKGRKSINLGGQCFFEVLVCFWKQECLQGTFVVSFLIAFECI